MTRKQASGKIDASLERAVDKLLKDVTLDKKDADGKPLYTLTDVMKVIAAKTKLEAIKMKAEDSGYGSGFIDDDDKGE